MMDNFIKSNTSAEVSAVFQVTDVPPLGYSIYTAKPTKGKTYSCHTLYTICMLEGTPVSHVHTPASDDDVKVRSKVQYMMYRYRSVVPL